MLFWFLVLELVSSKLLLVFQFVNDGILPNNVILNPNENHSQIMHKNLLSIGFKAREKYIQNSNFLSQQYNHSEIYVKTSDFSESIKNGYLILNGLYPIKTGPFLNKNFPIERAWPPYNDLSVEDNLNFDALPSKYQPIPIHNTNMQEDFLFHANKLCPPYANTVKNEKNSSNYFFYEDKAIELYKTIINSGNKNLSYQNMTNSLKNIEETIFNISNEQYNISYLFLKNLTSLREMLKLTSDTAKKIQIELILTYFLQYFKEMLQSKIRTLEKNNLKYILFLGDEKLMFSLVTLFNLSSSKCLLDIFQNKDISGYLNCISGFSKVGSHLSFELYSYDNSSHVDAKQKYYMKLFYNGKEMNLFDLNRVEASLNEIKTYIENFILNDFKRECQSQAENIKISNSIFNKNKKLQEAEDELEANYEFITALIILETILIIIVCILIHFRKKNLL